MTKEEFLQSFDDNALLQEIDLLQDMVSMFASGASNDQVGAKYGFYYDTPEDDLAVLQDEAIKRGLIAVAPKSAYRSFPMKGLIIITIVVVTIYLLTKKKST